MSDESSSLNKTEDSDFENMKVIDLKKRLKSYGLSVTGNKSELVERLQNLGKGIDSMPEVESTLLNDSSETNALNESENPLLEEFSLSPPEKDVTKEQPLKPVDSTTNSNPVSVPLKKRAVAQAVAETVKVEKKIVLKRNNIPTPQIIPSKPAVPLKSINIITMDLTEKSTNDNKEPKGDNSESSKDGKSVIRLASAPAKSLSELEKFVLRAERFKTESSKDKPKPQVLTPSLAAAVTSNVSSISASVDLSSIDALKKRAERFGQNVSTVMKKMEDQQRILKRKSKFGSIGTGNGISSAEEQEKKKRRLERFGI